LPKVAEVEVLLMDLWVAQAVEAASLGLVGVLGQPDKGILVDAEPR
jgi:hypothetical protein